MDSLSSLQSLCSSSSNALHQAVAVLRVRPSQSEALEASFQPPNTHCCAATITRASSIGTTPHEGCNAAIKGVSASNSAFQDGSPAAVIPASARSGRLGEGSSHAASPGGDTTQVGVNSNQSLTDRSIQPMLNGAIQGRSCPAGSSQRCSSGPGTQLGTRPGTGELHCSTAIDKDSWMESFKSRPPEEQWARYGKSSLKSVLQMMGCKARHAHKMSEHLFGLLDEGVMQQQSLDGVSFIILGPGRFAADMERHIFEGLIMCQLAEYGYNGPRCAAEARVACSLQERRACVTVLLCGTSGTGKSTLASLLAGRLGVTTIVSTDSVRHMLRSLHPREEAPLLWVSTYEAGNVVRVQSGSDQESDTNKKSITIAGYKAQADSVMESLEALVSAAESRQQSMVVEGVHLAPNAVVRMMSRHPSVVPFLVYISNESKHRERFAVRAKHMTLDPGDNKYIKNIRSIRTIQEYMARRADKHAVPKVDNTNVDRSVATIHATLIGALYCRAQGEPFLDPVSRTTQMVAREFSTVCGDTWSSKDMLALIRHKSQGRMPQSLAGMHLSATMPPLRGASSAVSLGRGGGTYDSDTQHLLPSGSHCRFRWASQQQQQPQEQPQPIGCSHLDIPTQHLTQHHQRHQSGGVDVSSPTRQSIAAVSLLEPAAASAWLPGHCSRAVLTSEPTIPPGAAEHWEMRRLPGSDPLVGPPHQLSSSVHPCVHWADQPQQQQQARGEARHHQESFQKPLSSPRYAMPATLPPLHVSDQLPDQVPVQPGYQPSHQPPDWATGRSLDRPFLQPLTPTGVIRASMNRACPSPGGSQPPESGPTPLRTHDHMPAGSHTIHSSLEDTTRSGVHQMQSATCDPPSRPAGTPSHPVVRLVAYDHEPAGASSPPQPPADIAIHSPTSATIRRCVTMPRRRSSSGGAVRFLAQVGGISTMEGALGAPSPPDTDAGSTDGHTRSADGSEAFRGWATEVGSVAESDDGTDVDHEDQEPEVNSTMGDPAVLPKVFFPIGTIPTVI